MQKQFYCKQFSLELVRSLNVETVNSIQFSLEYVHSLVLYDT